MVPFSPPYPLPPFRDEPPAHLIVISCFGQGSRKCQPGEVEEGIFHKAKRTYEYISGPMRARVMLAHVRGRFLKPVGGHVAVAREERAGVKFQ